MRRQKEVQRQALKQREDIQNEISHGYFPYTHGDHIEREREYIKAEMREDMQTKQIGAQRKFGSENGSIIEEGIYRGD